MWSWSCFCRQGSQEDTRSITFLAKPTAKINNESAALRLASGAEITSVDSTFARKVGCTIDNSQRQECVEIG
ncbi:hypothetical protein PHMEG_0009775 [Phytophthora megakarya]|uniref:Uncharacterized protein n=1 Tax=Phytophthora megakarya TaxID=4795 RepID=A0A225WGR3_9STRA|nr:hypothetical protein PHMEG_0009775 [Phytophthora megakarya]